MKNIKIIETLPDGTENELLLSELLIDFWLNIDPLTKNKNIAKIYVEKYINNIYTISPNDLNNGDIGIITHWVNQPDYIGNTIKKINNTLIMIEKNSNIETNKIDMRYPHHCKINLIPNTDNKI